MSEFMGNIKGVYDAKEQGFIPGSSSLHSAMSGHGPESAVFEKASGLDGKSGEQKPQFIGKDGMAFMFETCYLMNVTDYAKDPNNQDQTYIQESWGGLKKFFNPSENNVHS